jgi:hypothetical protein
MKKPGRAVIPKDAETYSVVYEMPPGAKFIQFKGTPGGVPITPELRERFRRSNRLKVIVHPPEPAPES